MALDGIDVSSNQPAEICRMVSYDFAIVKATGNPPGHAWDYVNPFWQRQIDDALAATGCGGLYHFTHGLDANAEADFFIDQVKDYIGRVLLAIDYEGGAVKRGRAWLQELIVRIQNRAGVAPVVYASSSVIKEQGLAELCRDRGCALWSANYWRGYEAIVGYDRGGCRMDVAASVMWQYTSSGHLDGYDGNLDLDVFFGDAGDWAALCSRNESVSRRTE